MPSLAKARHLLSQALALLTILFLFAFILLLIAYVAWPYASNKLWPTSAYYELHSVEVSDAKLGEPVPLRAFRDIRKPFLGSYITSVREVGHSTPICNGGGDSTYRPQPGTSIKQNPRVLDRRGNARLHSFSIPRQVHLVDLHQDRNGLLWRPGGLQGK